MSRFVTPVSAKTNLLLWLIKLPIIIITTFPIFSIGVFFAIFDPYGIRDRSPEPEVHQERPRAEFVEALGPID